MKPIPSLFIGGSGRCGTNVLKNVLLTNSRYVGLPFESRFTVDPDGLFPTLRQLSCGVTPYIADRIVLRLERLLKTVAVAGPPGSAHAAWELDEHIEGFSSAAARLITGLVGPRLYEGSFPSREKSLEDVPVRFLATTAEATVAFAEFFDHTIRGVVGNDDGVVYVDDNTWNPFFAEELVCLRPTAVIVHVVRNPLAVVESFTRQPWSPTSVDAAVDFYCSVMDGIARSTGHVTDSVVTVRIEDLVDAPERELGRIARCLGADRVSDKFDPQELDSGRLARASLDLKTESKRKLQPFADRFGYDL